MNECLSRIRRSRAVASLSALPLAALWLALPVSPVGGSEGAPAVERAPPTLGALAGRVRLAGHALPRPTSVENTTDPAHCGRDHTLEDLLVSAESRGIGNVILSLSGVPADQIPPFEPQALVLDNVGCRFVPHAAVLTVGSMIEAVNSDSFLHTAHLYGAVEMNIALPHHGSRGARIVKAPGMVVVKCDIHAWMQAFIRVDSHPFHTVSDADGRFRIPDVPPGSYMLEIWHERLGPRRQPVRVKPGETLTVDIEYQPRKGS